MSPVAFVLRFYFFGHMLVEFSKRRALVSNGRMG